MTSDERRAQVAAARDILERTCGAIHDTELFQTWGPTVVVGAMLANGPKVVIKASAMQDVRVEAKVSSMAAAAGVSVPRVLGQGDDARLPGEHWFAMEHLRGVWWHNADSSDHANGIGAASRRAPQRSNQRLWSAQSRWRGNVRLLVGLAAFRI